MRTLVLLATIAALAGCNSAPPLPKPRGPLIAWNLSMQGIPAPLGAPQALSPDEPLQGMR